MKVIKIPTKEQEQWFWEQCGLEYHDGYFYDVSGKQRIAERHILTLDNLWQYAVPKMECVSRHYEGGFNGAEVLQNDTDYGSSNQDLALALFWAIYKAFGGEGMTDKLGEKIANFYRIMRAEGKLRRFTPESDAEEILSLIKPLEVEEVKKILESYFSEELGKGASEDIAQEICQLVPKLKLPPNPYPASIFPMDENVVGKLLGGKGLMDREITAISGCIARLGWNNAIQQVKELNKEVENEQETL